MNGSEFCYPEGKGLKACKTKPIGDWNKADALEQLEKNKKWCCQIAAPFNFLLIKFNRNKSCSGFLPRP